ncbi:NAD-dependent epimerase [Shouchella clausii]|uniref:NAD-dependent epimerase n=1 Tax=Shouchella clausii TaxID=79880 RepID=UPI000BA632EF|nr:NAD-dependent epimerase [Shouchella clausii]MBX0319598.1 NAD-dependent epimerase [Shouchella clausii]MCZ1182581.1 NAD-dependent epimerase [Shouchella clausii]MDO7283903.1 NAD-dependent epimerase [Shouchella clausii]MDO7303999.1 NAD-dependent epimerase [Shouchella clausii]PAF09776.1 capsular biosynthesis protein CpsI [Shouchella clausii]
MKLLVTGAAGFIGSHLIKRVLEENDIEILGVDNLNDYYSIKLKKERLKELHEFDKNNKFSFSQVDIANYDFINKIFRDKGITHVINLAAQAGVRYSIENPHAYIQSNLVGFSNILEASRHNKVEHLIYASSSSVYGANKKMPFSTKDAVNHPVSLYAATKKSNELLAHTYSHLYNLPTTGLRFFTVYGPWGRPDMAYFSFTKNIIEGKPIKVFNNGEMMRDFTYIDDIIEGIIRLIDKKPEPNMDFNYTAPDPSSSYAPYKIYNIGNNQPVKLMDFIQTIEKHVGKKAKLEFLPMQPGDVQATYADIDDLTNAVGFSPNTSIDEGIGQFVEWYRSYYK